MSELYLNVPLEPLSTTLTTLLFLDFHKPPPFICKPFNQAVK